MGYLIAGLAGVMVGAGVALFAALAVLQRRADRDLLERRMRSLLEYRERLGDPRRWLNGGARSSGVPALETEQLLANLEALAREFHLTAWLFDEPRRELLAEAIEEIERAIRRYREEEPAGGPPSLAAILGACDRFERRLRDLAVKTAAEHRRFRFLPTFRSQPKENKQ
ncbi:MAG: hypothetical protein HY717_01790 [Planctomycetes bacterium]|nr:hypothetical protein [Planctomycetota bacterium]